MEYIVKILDIENLTENIKKIKTEKPKNYNLISGQHALVSINISELKDKKRPFSFSSSDKDDFLEFIIKIYDERNGITKEFDKLKIKDELIIGEPKGKISYKGKGLFIAAGTGINPFISITKSLDETERENNFLIYSNGTKDQIILEKELRKLFNNNVTFILSREKKQGYEYGHIDK
ncbi:MAG: FAD-binding oxidoreductase, partial [bacterium]|nr:FAD-binding oxidoreductase [bacterium]